MILIIGASSTVGKAIIPLLLEAGHTLRLSSRDPGKLKTYQTAGVGIVQADLLEKASIERACQGVDQVLMCSHSIIGRGKNASKFVDLDGGRLLIDVARKQGVSHFVYLSALGASTSHSSTFFRHKAQVEAYLKQSGLSYTILRPSAFFLPHTVLHSQAFSQPQLALQEFLAGSKATFFGRGETPHNYVANEDVARFAFIALTDPQAVNQTIEIGGLENLTVREVAEIYSRATGIPKTLNAMPLLIPGLMHLALKPFHPGLSDAMGIAVENDRVPSPFDMTATLKQYPVALTRLEDWVYAQMRERQPVV
ncbi:MAG: SDR family oxidoreductase [Anaerolinea sp.]|nr:SDR family oxidoreductase [Anaerolinea sp.]